MRCSIDLGAFDSAEEAARAHDRAQLLAAGLLSPTNFPLADAFAAGAAACVQRGFAGQQAPRQGGEAGAQAQRAFHGVLFRAGAWLAMLEIGEPSAPGARCR